MPFPADLSDYQQQRVSQVDRELKAAATEMYRSLQRLKAARAQFLALGLSALWPATDAEFVHKERDASTRGEQNDLNTIILHAQATLLNEGTSSATPAQVAGIWHRYAR